MVLLADAEEAAERHDRVDGLAAHLVDHDVIDGAELLALQVVDVGPLHLLGGDQGSGCDLRDIGHGLLPGKRNGRSRFKRGVRSTCAAFERLPQAVYSQFACSFSRKSRAAARAAQAQVARTSRVQVMPAASRGSISTDILKS